MSNLELAHKLLDLFGLDDVTTTTTTTDNDNVRGARGGWIEYTTDRPFNDRRYAVDGAKLRKLGWKQSVSFKQGLRDTKEWYAKFSRWWGDIDGILASFPVVVRSGEGNGLIEQAKAGAGGDMVAPPARLTPLERGGFEVLGVWKKGGENGEVNGM